MPTTTVFDLDGISSGLTSVTPTTLGWDVVDANLTPEFEESAAMITRTAWNGDVVLSSTGNLTSTDRYMRPFNETEALSFIGSQGEGVVTRYKLSFEKGTSDGTDVVSQNLTHRPGGDYGRLGVQMGVTGTYSGDAQGVYIRPTECQDANDFGGSSNYGIGLEYNEIFYLDVYQFKTGAGTGTTDYEWAYAINGRMLCLKQHGSFRCRTAQELDWNTDFWDGVGLDTLYYLNVHEVTVEYDITGSSIKAEYGGIEDTTLGAWTDDSIVSLHGALYQVTGQAASTASTSFLQYDPCWEWENISSVVGGTIDTQTVNTNWQSGSTFEGLQYVLTDPDFVVESRQFRVPQHDGVMQCTIPIEQIGDNGVTLQLLQDPSTPLMSLKIDTGTGATTNLKVLDNLGAETDTGIALTRSANRYTIYWFISSGRTSVVVEDRQVASNVSTHIYSWSSTSLTTTLPTTEDVRLKATFDQSGTASDFKWYGPMFGRNPGIVESSYTNTTGFTDGTRPGRMGARDRRSWDANAGRGPGVLSKGTKGSYPLGPFHTLGRSGGDLEEWLDNQLDSITDFFDAWMGDLRIYDGRVNYVDDSNTAAQIYALHERLRDAANDGAAGTVLQIATTPSPHATAWTVAKRDEHRASNDLLRAGVKAGAWYGHYFADMISLHADEDAATLAYFDDLTDVHPGQVSSLLQVDWINDFNSTLTLAPAAPRTGKAGQKLITLMRRRRR